MSAAPFCPSCNRRKHKARVVELLSMFITELLLRGNTHDNVKFESPEREAFDGAALKLSGMTFNTPEYNKCKKEELGAALAHHYAWCRHHPEHFANGVDDMTLIDLVEFLVDCKAASEQQNDGNIMRSIDELSKNHNITAQLAQILRNTINAFSLKE